MFKNIFSRKTRYWFYLLLVFVNLVFLFNLTISFLSMSSTAISIFVTTVPTAIIFILDLVVGIELKEIMKALHQRLLSINEFYILIIFSVSFFIVTYLGGLMCNKISILENHDKGK